MITAYRHPDRAYGRTLINSLTHGVPTALSGLLTLGRTLTKRAADVLAFLDLPGTSNGPTEAINGRFEHLRGSALDFRDLTHFIPITPRGRPLQDGSTFSSVMSPLYLGSAPRGPEP